MKNPWIASLSLVLVAAVAPCASADLISSGVSNTAGPSSLTRTVVLITNTGDEPVSQTVVVTDVDFTIPTGSVFGQYVAEADFVTGSGSITLSGYVDTTNTPNPLDPPDFLHGAETLIGTADESTVPFTALAPLTLSGAYGLTLIVNLTLGPLSSLSYTH